jgi:hypothetical protein
LAEPLPEESAVVDGNGVAIAAELMDEFFHLLAKVRRAAGGRATNCHFCRGFEDDWQRRCRWKPQRMRAINISRRPSSGWGLGRHYQIDTYWNFTICWRVCVRFRRE